MSGQDQDTLYTSGRAAADLGVSSATLRRMADVYDQVFAGERLPRAVRQARLFPQVALDRLGAAKRLRDQQEAASLEAALMMVRDGVTSAVQVVGGSESTNPVMMLMDRLATIETKLDRLTVENAELKQQLAALPPPEDKSETEDLRRRLDYALGELERRDRFVVVRPWWKWWTA